MRKTLLTRVLALASVLVCGLMLGACGEMAPFVRPAAPLPANWSTDDAGGLRDARTWTLAQMYPDARLQAHIHAALEHNRDLHVALARVAEARALLGVSEADRLPTLNVSASAAATRTPGPLTSTGQPVIARRDDISVGITAFELDFWGRVKSLNEAARASYLASAAARDSFRLALVADVAHAYFSLLEFDERLQLARDTLKNREDFLFLSQRRRDVGLAGDLDVRVAEAALQGVRVQVAELARNRTQADNALALLLGAPSAGLPAARALAAQDVALDVRAETPSEVLLTRPDVRAAEERLRAAHANIAVARAAFLPRVSLNLALGVASNGLDGLFDLNHRAWNFTPSLLMPLFDAGRNAASLDVAEARKVVAVAEYERAIQQAFREVADQLAARRRLGEQLQAQTALETAQRERLRLVEARYRAGASSYLEVLDAQRDAHAAAQGTLQVRRALLTAAAQLFKALGMGVGT